MQDERCVALRTATLRPIDNPSGDQQRAFLRLSKAELGLLADDHRNRHPMAPPHLRDRHAKLRCFGHDRQLLWIGALPARWFARRRLSAGGSVLHGGVGWPFVP